MVEENLMKRNTSDRRSGSTAHAFAADLLISEGPREALHLIHLFEQAGPGRHRHADEASKTPPASTILIEVLPGYGIGWKRKAG